jgi:hypothetical protein
MMLESYPNSPHLKLTVLDDPKIISTLIVNPKGSNTHLKYP